MDPQETNANRIAGGAAAAGSDSGATAAPASGLGALGLQRPPRQGPLPSYVSEPPSTLAMMKTYAQELLLQQEYQRDAQQQQQTAQQPAGRLQGLPPAPARLQRNSGGSGSIPAARSGGSTPHGAPCNLELPTLGPRQFDAARHLSAPTEATPPLKRNLRSSIGRQEWVLALLLLGLPLRLAGLAV